MLNSIEDILNLHNNKGEIEDAYIDMHFDDKFLRLNTFTLKFVSGNTDKVERNKWNNRLNFEIRKNRDLTREIKEFRILFATINKLKIKNGYIEKRECPDFILKINKKTIGVEITKIYAGNDWVAEKLNDDIKTYNIDKKDIPGYIEYKKFESKIKTYKVKENIVIKPLEKIENKNEYKTKIKNKIFEKIRKMFDEYQNFDTNIILADIVSAEYLDDLSDVQSLNEELTFYINHLEVDMHENEYYLLLKANDKLIKFDIKNHNFDILW